MTECRHTNLVLLPESRQRMRCRHCHLTLTANELRGDYCPECFETSGKKQYDFEAIESLEDTKYRCEQCGAIIEYRLQRA